MGEIITITRTCMQTTRSASAIDRKNRILLLLQPTTNMDCFFSLSIKTQNPQPNGVFLVLPLYTFLPFRNIGHRKKRKSWGKKSLKPLPSLLFFFFFYFSILWISPPPSLMFFFLLLFFSLAGSPLWIFFLFLLPWSVIFFLSFSGSLEKSPSLIRSGSCWGPSPCGLVCHKGKGLPFSFRGFFSHVLWQLLRSFFSHVCWLILRNKCSFVFFPSSNAYK